jgi:2-polyprenyl-3-methyl-5-hydroxy-6-metoxy-1,4-benzoquinol methylase
MTPYDVQALNEEGRTLWDSKAAFWDQLHGDEGNDFHRTLVSPPVERLLALQTGERVLDIACGNGVLARRLAALGGVVTAVDFSAALIERARLRGQSSGTPIAYSVVDATDEVALLSLGEASFAAVVCTMGLMDIPVIAPLFRAARRLLRTGGRLVIATAHPAFSSNSPTVYAERDEIDGKFVVESGLKVHRYLDIAPYKSMGAPGENNAHYYYHRSLSELFGAAFAAGLVLDALEEPATLSPSAGSPYNPLSRFAITQLPLVLAARFKGVTGDA